MVRYAMFSERAPGGMPLFVSIRRLADYERVNQDETIAINRPRNRAITFHEVALQIIRKVQQEVRRYNRMTAAEVLTRVSGWLQAENRLTGVELGDEPIPVDPLNRLNARNMETYIQSIQSAEEVDFEDLDWRFTIDPNSITLGGAPKIKTPAYVSTREFTKTWRGYEGVNCAAYSINYFIQHFKGQRVRDTTLIRQSKELQEKLGWGLTVAPNDILRAFPSEFPKFKVVIINPLVPSLNTFAQGREYTSESGNVMYLVYDPRIQHFGSTLYPHRIWMKNGHSPNLTICGPCNEVFDNRKAHTCTNGGKDRVKKLRTTITCDICDKIRDYTHDCSVIQCKNCHTKYPRGETTHRCFVYEEDEEKRFNTDGLNDPQGVDSAMDGDGSLPCCFAYDIESRVDIRDEIVERIIEFKKSPNSDQFMEYDGSEEDIVIKHTTARYQQPNWIGIKNIYNNKSYAFTGSDCLHECLNFLLAYNRGNNHMWAHNAAGYDTRLIYDVACQVMGDAKIECTPRGSKFMILSINKTRRGALLFYDSLNHLKGFSQLIQGLLLRLQKISFQTIPTILTIYLLEKAIFLIFSIRPRTGIESILV